MRPHRLDSELWNRDFRAEIKRLKPGADLSGSNFLYTADSYRNKGVDPEEAARKWVAVHKANACVLSRLKNGSI